MIEHTGGWQVCVPEGVQVCGNGPLQVCADVGQVCAVPLQVCALEPVHDAPLHAAATKPLQTPALPWQSAGRKPLHVPVTRPLQLGAFLHEPTTLFWHKPAKALQVWSLKALQVCVCGAPVCGHDGLVGSHQMMFSFS